MSWEEAATQQAGAWAWCAEHASPAEECAWVHEDEAVAYAAERS